MIRLSSLVIPALLLTQECVAFTQIQRPCATTTGVPQRVASFAPSQLFQDLKKKNAAPRRRPSSELMALSPGGMISSVAKSLVAYSGSLFAYSGNVPLGQAFGLNAALFALGLSKLQKILTADGIFHALILGTGLWSTLGWRGWTVCVAYLFFGSAVTKVKFAEKEKKGIAEARGGRRGAENVW
jgi:hypothetical protein